MLDRAVMASTNKAIILKKFRGIGLNMLISHVKFGKHNFKNKICFLKKKFYVKENYRI